jgi:hypothetical protein
MLDGLEFKSQQELEILSSPKPSKLALWPTLPPVKFLLGFFPQVRPLGHKLTTSPSSAKVKNEWISTPPVCLLCMKRDNITFLPFAFLVKGKAIPLQAWTGPEGSRGLRLPDFKTVGT